MKKHSDPSTKLSLIAICLVILVGGLILYEQNYGSPQPISGMPSFVPSPSGRGQVFSVSSSNKNGPRLAQGLIDPYNPKARETQVMGIYVIDSVPVESVKVIMKTDHKASTYDLKLVGGVATDGYWEGSWILEDTYATTYRAVISAMSSRGESSVEITL